MFLSQVRRTRGMHLVGIADLSAERARKALASCGWDEQQYQSPSLGDAFKSGRTHITQDSSELIAFPDIEVIVEATGDPKAGIAHALRIIEHGKHVIMVNVEADVVAGPPLASQARAGGGGCSLPWGGEPGRGW